MMPLKIKLLLLGVVAGIFAVELVLRIVGFSEPLFVLPDSQRGLCLRPNASGWCSRESRVFIKINSHGMRDKERSLEKPERTLRVAVLGDSFMEAFQVPFERTFCQVLEHELSACPEFTARQMRVEVLNFGVSGYGTAQEFLTLQNQAWQFSPDLVILAFFAGNDLVNNSKDLETDHQRPFWIRQDGAYILDQSFRETKEFRRRTSTVVRCYRMLKNHARVLQLLSHCVHALKSRAPVQFTEEELGLDPRVYRVPAEKTWQEAWRVTEELLRKMNQETKRRDAGFLVITVSQGIQVHPDPKIRQAFMQRWELEDLHYAERRIEDLGRSGNFSVLDLVRPMQAYAQSKGIFLHGFKGTKAGLGRGHWNQNGHALAARIVAQELCRNTSHYFPSTLR